MKVLLINHFPLQGSGSGIYTLNVALEIQKTGNEVFVIDIDNRLSGEKYSFGNRTIICDSEKNKRYDLPFNFPCFTTHPRSNLTFYDLNMNQIQQYIDTFINVTNEVCRQFKPDIIHAQHLWIAPYAASKTGIPYVITAHGTDLMGFRKDKRYHPYALEGAQKSERIITISRQVHNSVKELYNIPEEQLLMNPNGFSEEIFRVKNLNKKKILEQFGINYNPKKIVGFVGKFTSFKGVDTLIDAAALVTLKYPEISFILAGDGELRPGLQQKCISLKLDNIHFLGHQSQDDVANLYNIADIAVVPSRIEPFGLVALEALACGTPVVATNAGGLPDFINNEIGCLVEMDNPEILAEAMITELQKNSKMVKGPKAAQYAVNNYSWSKTLEKIIDLYRESSHIKR